MEVPERTRETNARSLRRDATRCGCATAAMLTAISVMCSGDAPVCDAGHPGPAFGRLDPGRTSEEERLDLVLLRQRILAPDLDERARVARVEREVAQELDATSFRSTDSLHQVPEHRRHSLQLVGGQRAEIDRRPDHE